MLLMQQHQFRYLLLRQIEQTATVLNSVTRTDGYCEEDALSVNVFVCERARSVVNFRSGIWFWQCLECIMLLLSYLLELEFLFELSLGVVVQRTSRRLVLLGQGAIGVKSETCLCNCCLLGSLFQQQLLLLNTFWQFYYCPVNPVSRMLRTMSSAGIANPLPCSQVTWVRRL